MEAAAFAPMRRISFRVVRVVRGYISDAVAWPAVAASQEILTGDFRVDEVGLPNQITGANAGLKRTLD
ncbi:MAG: hypothetical protein DME21_00345 [Verrucomicrobia bacterium]|nr:MAG: hypothetical protein DME21_00345 [Verrucomicrobiota bacterium]